MWASVAATKTSQKATTKLLIKYNTIKIDYNRGDKLIHSSIPQHREIEAHPSDDFIMTNETELILDFENYDYWPHYDKECIDYTKDKYLKEYVSTLPYTIQEIARLAQTERSRQENETSDNAEVIDLDFVGIEKDLKSLSRKYGKNKYRLKQLFYPFNPTDVWDYKYFQPESNDFDKKYGMLFGYFSADPVHYIFEQLLLVLSDDSADKLSLNNQIKLIKQILKLLQLLITYDIIHLDWIFERGYQLIWDRIKRLQIDFWRKKCLKYIIDDLVDLFMVCLNKKGQNVPTALIQVTLDKRNYFWQYGYRNIKTISGEPPNMCRCILTDYDFIEKLLFRGVPPFMFVDESGSMHDLHDEESLEFIRHTMEDILYAQRHYRGDHIFQRRSIAAPLIMMPYLQRARNQMVGFLIECQPSYLFMEIANLVSDYMFMDVKEFDLVYNTEKIKMNNADIKYFVAVNKFWMYWDEIDVFDEHEMDQEFVAYFVDEHHLKKLISLIKYDPSPCNFIQTILSFWMYSV